MPVAKYWFFTLAHINPNNNSELRVHDDFTINESIPYIIFQLELGAGGFQHYQGVFHTSRAVKMGEAKRLIGFPDIHLEQCRSAAAHDYVTKEDTRIAGPWELGEKVKTGQGRRTDLEGVVQAVTGGARTAEIATKFPVEFIKYHRGIERLSAALQDRPRDPSITPNIWVFIGPSGTGKSRRAHEMGAGDLYPKPVDTKWWCGYNGQKFVLFDDFCGDESISSESLLSIVDRYPRIVEYKGGSRQLSSWNFIFTSNLDVDRWYGNSSSRVRWGEHHYEAFMRRVREGEGGILNLSNDE